MSFHLNLRTDLVRHLPLSRPLVVSPEATAADAIEQMQSVPTGCVVVCKEEAKLLGIFTERDVVKMIDQGLSFDVAVSQVMTASPATIQQDDSVDEAVRRMSQGGYRRLPVMDADGNLVSILKVTHILRYLVEHFPQFIYNLPPAPHHMIVEREGA